MIEIPISSNLVDGTFVFTWVISWHGFFSFVAVATSVIIISRWAPMKGVHPDDIFSIAIWAVIGGIVGARIVHVVDNWSDIYSQNPGQILAVWRGGIGIWGAILGGFLGGAGYALIMKHPVGVIADLTAPMLLFAQSIGRVGDIINGEHCAKATDFFLGMWWSHPESVARNCAAGFDEMAVQPVIIYEMLWNVAALALLWRLRGRLKPDGMLFAVYLALYSIGRFGVSFFREDRIWALGMQEAHYISLLVLAITIPLLLIKARFTERVEEVPVVIERGTRAQRRRRR